MKARADVGWRVVKKRVDTFPGREKRERKRERKNTAARCREESVIKCRAALTVKARDVGGDEYLRALFYTGDKPNVPWDVLPKIFEGLVENPGDRGRTFASPSRRTDGKRTR